MARGKRPLSDGDIPDWLEGPTDFDRPDPHGMTPMFDDLYRFFVTSEPVRHQKFADADGSVYRFAPPDEFEED